MTEDWIARWEQGRTGWHEADGSAALKRHWPKMPEGTRVLVPLCGKSQDINWLEAQGHEVIGVELSRIAVEAFFTENKLDFSMSAHGELTRYRCAGRNISIFCGDYFALDYEPCDALFDRGSLVALPADRRAGYLRHTKRLLRPDATRMLITLEYEQSIADGPPWSVSAAEVKAAWPDLQRVSALDDLENSPPKFRDAGLDRLLEVVWLNRVSQ